MMTDRVHVGEAHPNCPLCLKPFMKIPVKHEEFYVCFYCKVSINVLDPCIHLWGEYVPEEDDILCPNPKCRHEMRFFFRSDKYFAAVCPNPKCKCSLSSDEIDPDDGDFAVYWSKLKEGGN